MKQNASKWLIISLVLLGSGCTTIHKEVFIPAKPDQIWAELIDATSWKYWNTVLVPLEGEEFQEGSSIRYTVTQPNGSQYEVKTKVVEIAKEKKLHQAGGLPGFLTQDHVFLLEPVDGGTRLIQHEEFYGLYLLFWDTSWLESAYQKSAYNLRELVINGMNTEDGYN